MTGSSCTSPSSTPSSGRSRGAWGTRTWDRQGSFECCPVLSGWGCISLGEEEEVHLSQRRAGRRTGEEYYLPSVVVGWCG